MRGVKDIRYKMLDVRELGIGVIMGILRQAQDKISFEWYLFLILNS